MATVTKPIALDESFNTTEVTPRNIADVLAEELGRLGSKTASDVMYDNTDSGLAAENVQDALDEINGKVVQSDWEQADPTAADYIKNKPTTDLQTAVDTFSTLTGGLLSEAKLTLEPVQSGSGTPSPDNIRPISGHTEARLDVDGGKNRFNPSNVLNAFFFDWYNITAENNTRTIYAPCKPNTTYTVSKQAGQRYCVGYTSELPDIGVTVYGKTSDNTASSITITTGADAKYIVAYVWHANYDTITADEMLATRQIEEGSTATPYEPYKGASYVTPLGTTIYMANIEMVSGGADVIGVGVDISTLDYSASDAPNHVFRTDSLSGIIKPSDNGESMPHAICSAFSGMGWNPISASDNGRFAVSTGGGRVVFIDHRYSTVSDFVSGNSGVQLVYELATPQHIQLSPQLIQTLVGENNLSAPLDGQEITESKYKQMFTFDDVIAYIQSLS